jgi:phosphoribosyl-ATP pyrophosphohydrolase/phosphoribosyl-AMP cyclohydrolase
LSESQPILVKSSKITEIHSEGSVDKAFDRISLLGEVVLVDIDAALGRGDNRRVIKAMVDRERGRVKAVGGGIRTKEDLDYYLN